MSACDILAIVGMVIAILGVVLVVATSELSEIKIELRRLNDREERKP